MSARNSGLSACRSALRATQRQLADQVLDVVHDEGEAAVELVEALGVGERLLARAPRRASWRPGCRRCGTGRNPPSRAGGGFRARRARRGRPAGRHGSSGTPAQAVRSASSQAAPAAPCRAPPASRRGAPRNRGLGRSLRAAARTRALVELRRPGGAAAPSSTAPPAPSRRLPSLTSSSPPGRSTISASALTMRSSSGARVGPGAADRVGEAQPFLR